MNKFAKDYSEQIVELGKTFAEEATVAWQRYARMATCYQEGITPKQLGQGIKKFLQEDSPAYFRDMVQLQTHYSLEALKLGVDYNRQFFETLFTTESDCSRPPRDNANAPSADPLKPIGEKQATVAAATEIKFSGKAGEKLLRPFVVANHEKRAIKVSFELSDFVCQDGSTIADAKVSFDPPSFSLASNEDKVIECAIKPDTRFQAGKQYVAMARVVGFPNMLVRLILDVKPKK